MASALAGKEHSISDWQFGEVVHGESFTQSDLKGKVVVVDYWGTRCPPCIALIPHLVKLDKKHKDDGLMIIAPESQGSSKQATVSLMKKNKVGYTVTNGCTGPINIGGLPHAIVFDREGKIVYNGHPGDSGFDRAIRDALKEGADSSSSTSEAFTGPLVDLRTWTNQEGKTIKAALLSVEDDKAKLRLANSTVTLYEIAKLSKEDQDLIKEALAKE